MEMFQVLAGWAWVNRPTKPPVSNTPRHTLDFLSFLFFMVGVPLWLSWERKASNALCCGFCTYL
jgi:hypothetical protein